MKTFALKLSALVVMFAFINLSCFPTPLISINSSTDIHEIVDFDEHEILDAFKEVEPLVQILNEGDFNALPIPGNVVKENTLPIADDTKDDVTINKTVMGIPPFLWGFVLGIWGVVIVYIFSDKNEFEARKALNGCIVANALSVGIVLVFFVFTTSSATVYSAY